MDKHINLFKERFKIAFKEVKEYKINFYSLAIFNLIVIGKYFITLTVMKNLVGENFNWNQVDFLVFPILIIWGGMFTYSFSLKNFHRDVNDGNLNLGLIKPVNQFLFQIQKNIQGYALLNGSFFLLILLYIHFKYNYFNLLSVLFCFTGMIYFIIISNFVESFSFFTQNNFVTDLMKKTDRYNRTFTPKTFENANFEGLFMILPTAIYGYLTIEINKGNFAKLIEYSSVYLTLFIIMIIGTYFLWKLGLKKYGAYG